METPGYYRYGTINFIYLATAHVKFFLLKVKKIILGPPAPEK